MAATKREDALLDELSFLIKMYRAERKLVQGMVDVLADIVIAGAAWPWQKVVDTIVVVADGLLEPDTVPELSRYLS